jgi:hypothetical protein
VGVVVTLLGMALPAASSTTALLTAPTIAPPPAPTSVALAVWEISLHPFPR